MLAVAFFCAAAAVAGPADKPKRERSKGKPATRPVTQPAEQVVEAVPGSILAERRRLNRIPRSQRTVDEVAALAGIDFILAVANAEGARAAGMIDVVGYQQLPEGELLLEDPPRPFDPNTLAARIGARSRLPIGDLPVETVEVRPRVNLAEFPAVASWMTFEDRAFVVRAQEESPAGWIKKDACLVIRVRADKPTITGGTFFDVLPATVPPPVVVPSTPAAAPDSASASPAVGPLPRPPVGPPPLPPPTTQPAPQRTEPHATTQSARPRPATPPATQRAPQPATRPQSPNPSPPADEGPPEEDK